MLNNKFYALIPDDKLKYIHNTLYMFSDDHFISPKDLKEDIDNNTSKGFSVSGFFQKSKPQDILYLNAYRIIKYPYDYGIKGDYYLYSTEFYYFLNDNFKIAPHIVRKVVIHDKNGLYSSDFVGVYFTKNLDVFDRERSSFFIEKHTNLTVPTNFEFKSNVDLYDIFKLNNTYFPFVMIINKKLKDILIKKIFKGFEIIDVDSLRDYEEKRTGRKLYPKNYKKILP